MHAVILAGGKGTRLKELTAEIPKPMILICGKPVLLHQINCLKKSGIKKVTLIIGHLGHKIIEYFGDGKKFGVEIDYYIEKEPLGTGGALYFVKDRLPSNFILLYGDVFLNIDFNRMINYHKKNKSTATLFVHPNTHPYDSDIIIEKEGYIIDLDSKGNVRDYDYKNLVNAAIYVLSKKILERLDGKKCDFERDIIKKIIDEKQRVLAYKSTEYAKDMGTPERLISVEEDLLEKIPDRRNLKYKQKCIFLDRDGTINYDSGHINRPDQIILYPNSSKAIKLINKSDYICIVVTNQPVIARGESTFENMENIHKRLETLLGNEGVYVDDIIYCPHHPDKGYDNEVIELKIECQCRKPKPGMMIEAGKKYNIDFKKSIIIGDSTADIEAGQKLGMNTILVKTGAAGKDGKYNATPNNIKDDILDAVESILKKEI